ncbi:MAG: mannose-1-phosphate guanylyltransferase [Cyanobacteria bacterium REEB459]|nr:mannose-1-phosphate guanylyltransferase [Cyanobacteria bacterium REEB459]
MASLIPIILAGGKGERFWPVSRLERPKQFLRLDGSDRSLLQATADRLLDLAGGWDGLWVITAAHLATQVRQQLPLLPEANLLVEPVGRDTAPAVAWGVVEVAKRQGPEAVVGFFPADHWIADRPAFSQTLESAARLAQQQGVITTLGITPTYAATGYGYIEQGELVSNSGQNPVYRVARFTEKPDPKTAQSFIDSGRFSWNSGMFVFSAQTMLAELQSYAPQLIEAILAQGVGAYASLAKLSIDYAVMEHTQRAWVMPVTFGWDDLGDWNAVERLLKQPDQQNVDLATHLPVDTRGSIVYATDPEEVVVTIGLEDVVIVRDGKATLVVHKDRTQDIKKAVQQLGAEDRFRHLL